MAAATGMIVTIIFIILSEILPDPEALLPKVPPLITTGLVPFILAAGNNVALPEIYPQALLPQPFRADTIRNCASGCILYNAYRYRDILQGRGDEPGVAVEPVIMPEKSEDERKE
jgi:hypothetical protein